MDGWNKLSSGLAGLNIGQSANKFAKGFQSSVQATRERLGQVAPDEITELPQGTSWPAVRAAASSDRALRSQSTRT